MSGCFSSSGWEDQEGGNANLCPSLYKTSLLLPRPPYVNDRRPPASLTAYGLSQVSSSSSSVSRATSASKIHSLAEKKRRERINAHLSTLRSMIPNSSKLDKASLLGTVIEQVKNLKSKATDISQVFPIPREYNEVTVELFKATENDTCPSRKGSVLIRASISCDERSELYGELKEAFVALGFRVEKADMVSLGGRAINVFVLSKNGDCDGDDEGGSLSSLMKNLREKLGRIAPPEEPSIEISGKRRRLLQSNQ